MTRAENKELIMFLDSIYSRINRAKSSIKDMNFGKALQVLSEPYPKLNIKIEDSNE